jgi:hypothetical protein
MTNEEYTQLRKSAEERSERLRIAFAELEQTLIENHKKLERDVRWDMMVMSVLLTVIFVASIFVIVSTFIK